MFYLVRKSRNELGDLVYELVEYSKGYSQLVFDMIDGFVLGEDLEDDFFQSNNAKIISEEEFEEIANGYGKEEIVFVKDENSIVWRYSEDDEGDTRLYRDLMTEFISNAPDDMLLYIMGIDK